MKKDKIINNLKEVLTNKKKRSMLLIISAVGIIFTVLIFKADYIKSVIDGDPNYEKLKEKMAVYAYRKTISLEEFEEGGKLVEDSSDKPKGPITAANVLGGFDQYTPTSVTNDDSDENSNSNWSGTNINNTNTSNDVNNTNSNSTTNNTQGQSNVNKEEAIIDKSSFTGKDVIVLEGEKFDPFEILQLSARDIDGKNITNKIVISENNVNIYKPGLYDVKANVELSDGRKLYKEFLVRVEPVKLQLAVKDIEVSKGILQKKEMYNMSFKVNSSKNYLDIATVNINGKEYYPNKVATRGFFNKYDTYSIQLVASDKAGIENINFNTITMSDGTVIDINEFTSIEVLKDKATISDVLIEKVESNSGEVKISFEIKDVDDTIKQSKIYVYDEDGNIIIEEEVEKNKAINSILNVAENGIYTIKIIADEKIELVTETTKDAKKIELYSTSLEIDAVEISSERPKENNLEIKTYTGATDESEGQNGSGDSPGDGSQGPNDGSDTPSEGDQDQNTDNDSSSGGSEDPNDGSGSQSDGNQEQNGGNDSSTNENTSGYEQKYSTGDKLTAEIMTKGKMTNDAGETPKKTISVTVPTMANFTVDKDANFIGTTLNITNNGEVPVSISVGNFIDVNGDSGIKLVTDSSVKSNASRTSYKRNEINLYVEGQNNKRIYLGDRNLYPKLGQTVVTEEQKEISKVLTGKSCQIKLSGEAGTSALDSNEPIQDRFTLILKIKKSS
ncbi:hypothetical protein [Clostridium sp.]|uniref:hypothetical protein n=1 Tax=Clostridium sp. TaxID=1506 RepID=UPI002618D289|nr:hypothetical protein [Clostridium sp.]